MPQDGCVIEDANGNVMEYGITGRGGATRIKEKLRTKYKNAKGYTGRVIEPGIQGRRKALDREKEKVRDYKKENGRTPLRQERPDPKTD